MEEQQEGRGDASSRRGRSSSSSSGGTEMVWMSIGGQAYAVPVRKKKASPAEPEDRPRSPPSSPSSSSLSASASPPKRKLSVSAGAGRERSKSVSDSSSSASPVSTSPSARAASGEGGWRWLGGLGLNLGQGVGLAESTLSGLYSAVSSSAAYIVHPLIEDEPIPPPSEQEKKELAITADLIDFVSNVSDHPSTFTNFPVETSAGPQPARLITEGVYTLSAKQAKHATAMLALVPKLQQLRHDLVPSQLVEDTFWQVYFSLIKRKTEDVDWERDKIEEVKDEQPEGEPKSELDSAGEDTSDSERGPERREKLLETKVWHRREVLLEFENDEDEEEDASYKSEFSKISMPELRKIWSAHKNGYSSVTKLNPHYNEDSAHLEKLWEGMVFHGKEAGRLVSDQFAHLIKQGIAPSQRTTLWPLLADAATIMRKHPTLYEEALQHAYLSEEAKQELAREVKRNEEEQKHKDLEREPSSPNQGDTKYEPSPTKIKIVSAMKVPVTFFRIPTYGGNLMTSNHWLNGEGISAAKRLLIVFALENPEWDFVPCLPDLVLLLLHYLPEPVVYATIASLLSNSIPLSPQYEILPERESLDTKSCDREKLRFINRNKKETELSQCTLVDCLLAQHLPHIHAHLNGPCREVLINRDFQKEMQQWMNRLFVGVLPLTTVFKIVDNVLAFGVTIIYQVALRILKANEDSLLQATTGQQFMKTLRFIPSHYAEHEPDDSFIFSDAPVLADLNLKIVVEAELKGKGSNPQLEAIQDPPLSVAHLPAVKQTSLVITQEQFEVIWQWLPERYRMKDPVRHFSSSKDGFSLLSIYRKCKNSAPHIFIIKTKQGKIFGAYLTDGWRPSTKFYGSGECFLFTLHPVLRKYGWSAPNKDLFMIGNSEKSLIIGGGEGCGIWLDGELWQGSSNYCSTFRNDPLSGTSVDFEAVAVEIYALI